MIRGLVRLRGIFLKTKDVRGLLSSGSEAVSDESHRKCVSHSSVVRRNSERIYLPRPEKQGRPLGERRSRSREVLSVLKTTPPIIISLFLLVLFPSVGVSFYFAFVASDQFTVETRFTVRQIENERDERTGEVDSGPLSGSGSFSIGVAGQNAYIVTSYIGSRAIVDAMVSRVNLREIFRRPEADVWARLERDASIDELADYWKSMVSTYIDGPSGIVTLRTRAFRPDDAVTLASTVLALSEDLVNGISDRARHDAMNIAQAEVRRTYKMTQEALVELRKFRDRAGMINPIESGSEIGKLLIPLLNERVQLESELFAVSRSLNENAPTLRALKLRLEATNKQVLDLKNKLTNSNNGEKSLASALAEFEDLELQRQFAEKLYTLSQANFDRARQRADRQTLYLSIFVPPSLPHEARYPKRLAFSVLVSLALLILWAIGAMIFAAVEDHRL